MDDISAQSADELAGAARKLLQLFEPYRLFALYGEMGVGKTSLVKAFCSQLNIKDNVSSPSFGLVHEYRGGSGIIVYHLDFYRIDEIQEVFDLGYEDYFFSGEYCFIEWPEIAESLLPPDTVRLQINRKTDHSRMISLLHPASSG